jgi:hypothetical protein
LPEPSIPTAQPFLFPLYKYKNNIKIKVYNLLRNINKLLIFRGNLKQETAFNISLSLQETCVFDRMRAKKQKKRGPHLMIPIQAGQYATRLLGTHTTLKPGSPVRFKGYNTVDVHTQTELESLGAKLFENGITNDDHQIKVTATMGSRLQPVKNAFCRLIVQTEPADQYTKLDEHIGNLMDQVVTKLGRSVDRFMLKTTCQPDATGFTLKTQCLKPDGSPHPNSRLNKTTHVAVNPSQP